MITIRIFLYFYPSHGGHGKKMPINERLAAIWKIIPIFFIFVVIMAGLYLGFFTATESAAVGVILVIILIFLKGDLTIKMLTDATWSTIRTVGSLYLIVVGASMFNFLITVTQMPFTVVDFIDSLALTPLGII